MRTTLGLLVTLGALASACWADEVLMKDGSRIVGTVKRLADGKLTVATDFAGTLPIDAAKVVGMTTAEPLNVRMTNGDRAAAKLTYVAGQGQRVTGSAFGDADVELTKIDAIWPVGEDAPQIAAIKAALAKAKPKWALKLSAGVEGETGNTERVGGNAKVEVKRTTEDDRLKLYFQTRYARENGVDTTRETLGGVDYEADITKRWFGFGDIELENDRFENLELRTTAAGGVGYFVIREDKHELKLRAGPGYRHESFRDGSSDGQLVGQAGLFWDWQLAPWLTFSHSTEYTQGLEDSKNWQVVFDTSGEIPLDKEKVWKLKLGMKNSYDGNPQPTVENLDTWYYANIVVEIK